MAAAVLRLLTCGSVDDGKSTLIGRLLHDTQLIMEDTLASLARDSRKHGTTGEDIDFALLLDGLEAEREQGITIDVAYRFFETPARKFIVADTPGHEHYTRNMATGASTADLAIVLVDARKGLLPQTRRHTRILSLLGIRQIVLAVNKMDLVDHDAAVFRAIVADYHAMADGLGFDAIMPIPMSARAGANVARRAAEMPWYAGPTLLEHLETVAIASEAAGPARFPVQWVNRPDADFRGFSGTLVSGQLRVGDALVVARSGVGSTVKRIVTADTDLAEARAGDAITLVLADEIDVSRGDLLAPAAARPHLAQQFAAKLLWLQADEMIPGRPYLLRAGPFTTTATITLLKHRIDVNSGEPSPARTLAMNEIGLANIDTVAPLAFDAYADNRDTGGFILIDRFTNQTVGAGMILHPLRRAANVHLQAMAVDQAQRSALKGHQPAVLWFTGLSGSGKSTIASALEARLAALGCHTYALDGDNVRHGLNRDLGFTDADRVENIRRIAEVAALMADAGLITTCSFISPFRAERQLARERVGAARFFEIFVDAPIELCMARDPKGLYAKARAGEIRNFTGFDSPYEPPEAPDLTIASAEIGLDAAVDAIIAALRDRRILP
ncbi:MAG: sulfate adenylyltransferase subunit CysN [Sphingomonadales bacterium]|jgi:bifunctional enzyme CysN/CysC